MLGVVAWTTNGMGRTGALGAAAVAPRYAPSVTAAATSTCIGRVTTGCAAPATVDATRMVGSPIHPTVGSGIAAITSYCTTSKGAPWGPTSARTTKGTGTTVGCA